MTAGPWQAAPNCDADIAPCGRCGKDVVLDHDPPQPCGLVYCPECPDCDCRECATARMFASGIYDPDADPLTQRPVESREEYLARTRLPGFDPKTNSYRRTTP